MVDQEPVLSCRPWDQGCCPASACVEVLGILLAGEGSHCLQLLGPGSSVGVPYCGHSLLEGFLPMDLVEWILESGSFFAQLQVSATGLELTHLDSCLSQVQVSAPDLVLWLLDYSHHSQIQVSEPDLVLWIPDCSVSPVQVSRMELGSLILKPSLPHLQV